MQKLKPKKQKQIKSQTVDYPDQIKFFEAFQSRQSQRKLPIKPVGAYFKEDVDKLKQCTEEMQLTMMRVEQERAIKSEREKSQINELVKDFKNYQNQLLMPNAKINSQYHKRIINKSLNPKDDDILKQIAFISNIVVEKATDRHKSDQIEIKINAKRNSTQINSKQFVIIDKVQSNFQKNKMIEQNRNNNQHQVQMKAQLNQIIGKIEGNQRRNNNQSIQDQIPKEINQKQFNMPKIQPELNQRQILFQDMVINHQMQNQHNMNSIQQLKKNSPNKKSDELEPNKIIVTQIESSHSLQNNVQPLRKLENNQYGSFMDLEVNQNIKSIVSGNISALFDKIQDSSKYLQNEAMNQLHEKFDPLCKSQDEFEKNRDFQMDDATSNKKISDVFFGSIYQITNLDLNKNGSLAKIATAGYAKGNWKGQQSQAIKNQKLKSISPIRNKNFDQIISPDLKYKIQTPLNQNSNLNYYRYPNLGEHVQSNQFSIQDNQINDNVKSENEYMNEENKSIKKVQSIMNRPLLQSKANYSTFLQKNAIEHLLKTQIEVRSEDQSDIIQRFRYSNKRDYNIQQVIEIQKSRKHSYTGSAEKDLKTYVQGRSIQSQSRQSSERNSIVYSNKSIKNQVYLNLREDTESMNIRAVEQLIKSQNLLPINNLDITSRTDIQNALQLEREQNHLFSQAKSDKKLINFKGTIRNTMQENLNQEKTNIYDNQKERTALTQAVYSRLRIQSGKQHNKHLRQVKKRKEFENLQMQDINNVKQMTKLQIQFERPSSNNNEMNLKQQLQEIQCAIMRKKPKIQQISSRNMQRQKSLNKNALALPAQKQMQIQFNGKDMIQSQSHFTEMMHPKAQKMFQVNNIFDVNGSIVSTGRFTLQASQKFDNGILLNKNLEQVRLSTTNTLVSKNLQSNQQNKSYIFDQSSNNKFQIERQASVQQSQQKQSEYQEVQDQQKTNISSVEKVNKNESGLKKMNPSIRSIHTNNSDDKDAGQGSKFEAKSIYIHKNLLHQQALMISGSKESFIDNRNAKQNLSQTSSEKQNKTKHLLRAKTMSSQNNKQSVYSSHKKNGPLKQTNTQDMRNGTIQEEDEQNKVSLIKQSTQFEKQNRGNLLGNQFQDKVTLSNRQYKVIESTSIQNSKNAEKKSIEPIFSQNIYLVIEQQKNQRNTEMLLMDNSQLTAGKKDLINKSKKFEQNITNIIDDVPSESNLTPAQKMTQKLKPNFEQATQDGQTVSSKNAQSPQNKQIQKDQKQNNASYHLSNQKEILNSELDKKNDGQYSLYSKTLSQNTCRVGFNVRDLAKTNLGFAKDQSKLINFQNQNDVKIVCEKNLPKNIEKILKNAPIILSNFQRTQENLSVTIENTQNYRRTASYNLKNRQQKKTLQFQSLGRIQTANRTKENINIQKMFQNNKGLKNLFQDTEIINNQENSYQLHQNEILNQINNKQNNYALSFQSSLSVTSQEKIKRNIKSSQDAFARNTNVNIKHRKLIQNENQEEVNDRQDAQNDQNIGFQKTGAIDRQFSDFIKESLINARSYLFSQGGKINSQNNKMDSSYSYQQQFQKVKKVRLSSATTVDIRKSQINTDQNPVSSVLNSATIPWSNTSGVNPNQLNFGEQRNTIFTTGRSTMHMTNFKKNDFKREEKFQRDSEHDSNMIGLGVIQSALNTNINITQMSTKRQQSAKGQNRKPQNMNQSTFQQYLQKINENSKSIQSIDFRNSFKPEQKKINEVVQKIQVDQSFRQDEFSQNFQNPFKQIVSPDMLNGKSTDLGQIHLKKFMDDEFENLKQKNHQTSVNHPRIINDVLNRKYEDESKDFDNERLNQTLAQQTNLFKARYKVFSGKKKQTSYNIK